MSYQSAPGHCRPSVPPVSTVSQCRLSVPISATYQY
ncbi:unnamed protein product, partial [Staurois parvus]